MYPRTRSAWALLGVLLLAGVAQAADPLPPAAAWIPDSAFAVAEVRQSKAVFDLLLSDKMVSAVTALPQYRQVTAAPQFQQFRAVVTLFEAALGTTWQRAARTLTGGGVTLAAGPEGGVVLIADSDDPALLKQLHDLLVKAAEDDARKKGHASSVKSIDYAGVTCWTVGGKEAHAIVGKRLVVTNNPTVLRAVLDLRGKTSGTLAQSAKYQAAVKTLPGNAVARVFLDTEFLRRNPRALAGLKLSENPLGVLLAAGLVDSLREATWWNASLEIEKDTFLLASSFDAKAAEPGGSTSFSWPSSPSEGALANLNVPRSIAAASFYRDLHGFYAAKDKLFPQRTGGLIFFENMMGIFFSGLDLTEEVLAQARPEFRFVVAEQQYDRTKPNTQFPAFAAVFRVKNPDKFGEILEAAWQKAIGLANITRGQKALPGLIITQPSHGGAQFSMAHFPATDSEDGESTSVRVNFQPTLARLGDYVILSSAQGLTKDLIDLVKKEQAQPPKPVAGLNTLVELDGAQLNSILVANREGFVRQTMLSQAVSEDAAGTRVDLFMAVAKRLGRLKFQISNQEGKVRAALEVKLNLP